MTTNPLPTFFQTAAVLKLGKTIKRIRNDRGISQSDLAASAKVTPSFLSLLENDRRHPSSEVLKRLADALDLPEEVLIWDAVEVPENLGNRDRRLCETAKTIVRKFYEAYDADSDQDKGRGG